MKRFTPVLILILLSFVFVISFYNSGGQSLYPGQHPEKLRVKPGSDRSPLTFELTEDTGNGGIKLIPYYRLHHQRYVIYWDLIRE